jgi:uncharacterized membrane protein YtjA (UPF0391 family)
MIRAAIGFFILAIIAIILGANGIAGLSMEIGKLLLVVFLVLSIGSLIFGLITGGNYKKLK